MDYSYCERCGRRLRNPKAIHDGMGKTCRRKAREAAAKAEFERNQQRLDLAEQ
jgi:hypothetical protein